MSIRVLSFSFLFLIAAESNGQNQKIIDGNPWVVEEFISNSKLQSNQAIFIENMIESLYLIEKYTFTADSVFIQIGTEKQKRFSVRWLNDRSYILLEDAAEILFFIDIISEDKMTLSSSINTHIRRLTKM